MRIPFAPLQKASEFSREWLQWFSSLSQGVSGIWGVQERTFGLPDDKKPDQSYLSYTGRQMHFFLQWNDGIAFQNSKLVLDKEDLSMVGGRLMLINNGAIVNSLTAIDKEVTIPDTTLAGEVIIQGTIISKVERS
jgi:hypothetical protein